MIDPDAIERIANEGPNHGEREVLLADCVRTLAAEVRRLRTLLGHGGAAEVRECADCHTPYADFIVSSQMRCAECRRSAAIRRGMRKV